MLEAYLAAILVDSDFDYAVIEDFFTAHIKPFFIHMSLYDTFANKHPTVRSIHCEISTLIILTLQKTYLHNQLTGIYGCSDYCLKSGEMPATDGEEPRILAAVMIHGIPVSEAVGISGRYAKVRASEGALDALSGMLPEEFRNKFGCGCKPSDMDQVQRSDMGTAA